MTKQERKDWDRLVNYAYSSEKTSPIITIDALDLKAITAADVHIRKLERQLGEKKVAALLRSKIKEV